MAGMREIHDRLAAVLNAELADKTPMQQIWGSLTTVLVNFYTMGKQEPTKEDFLDQVGKVYDLFVEQFDKDLH